MLPIIIAQLVVLLKDTSLAFILGYNEIINVGLRQGPTTFGAKYLFTLFFVVWAIYLIINMGLSWVARIVARRTASGGKPGRKGRKAERVIAQLGGAGVSGAECLRRGWRRRASEARRGTQVGRCDGQRGRRGTLLGSTARR